MPAACSLQRYQLPASEAETRGGPLSFIRQARHSAGAHSRRWKTTAGIRVKGVTNLCLLALKVRLPVTLLAKAVLRLTRKFMATRRVARSSGSGIQGFTLGFRVSGF